MIHWVRLVALLGLMTMSKLTTGVLALWLVAVSSVTQAAPMCALLADAATDKLVKRMGQHCAQRFTPASTFKIPLSLIGYDSGFLTDEHLPAIAYREGSPALDPSWKTTVDPSSWIKNSVVWYSQQITSWLGKERLQRYVTKFNYGNQDLSGNPGMNDGLTQAWLSSSLRISPLEQARFLERLLARQLPVSARAYEMTRRLLYVGELPNGWSVRGKAGTGFQMQDDGTPDLTRQIGWFVGWAAKGKRNIVFVYAVGDEQAQPTRAGLRARETFMEQLPGLLDALPAAAEPAPAATAAPQP
jgi:beta-lactamase class D